MSITVSPPPTDAVAAAYARIEAAGVDLVESLTPQVTVEVAAIPLPPGLHVAPGLHATVNWAAYRFGSQGWVTVAPGTPLRLRVAAVLTGAGFTDRRIRRVLER